MDPPLRRFVAPARAHGKTAVGRTAVGAGQQRQPTAFARSYSRRALGASSSQPGLGSASVDSADWSIFRR